MFGLEYDLDLFNIVAVDDFNMGEHYTGMFVDLLGGGRAVPQRRARLPAWLPCPMLGHLALPLVVVTAGLPAIQMCSPA